MSSLQTTPGNLLFNLLSRHSFAISTESRIYLPPTNEFWDSEIRLSKTALNLLANTLDSSLYTLPTKLMGRKSLMETALHLLGIRVRNEAFKDRSNIECRCEQLSLILKLFPSWLLRLERCLSFSSLFFSFIYVWAL